MNPFPYQITCGYSDEDQAFLATVPAIENCLAYGETAAEAVAEVQTAAEAMLAALSHTKKEIPAPDAHVAKLRQLASILKLASIARLAGINTQTFASKLSRGTHFSPQETARITQVLAAHGLSK